QGGLVGLALRGDADLQIDEPAWIDLHVGALERPDPGALEVCGEPDADRPGRPAARVLRGAPLVVAEAREQAIERGRIVGWIVDDGDSVTISKPRGVGHLVRADEVAPSQGRGIQAGAPCRAVE